jgi:hypothetical protein
MCMFTNLTTGDFAKCFPVHDMGHLGPSSCLQFPGCRPPLGETVSCHFKRVPFPYPCGWAMCTALMRNPRIFKQWRLISCHNPGLILDSRNLCPTESSLGDQAHEVCHLNLLQDSWRKPITWVLLLIPSHLLRPPAFDRFFCQQYLL